jgi:murein DD-endopeptidase MepM/ murein hydrolase activator NlpD
MMNKMNHGGRMATKPVYYYPVLPMAKYSVQNGTEFLSDAYERITGSLHSGADFNAVTGGDSDLGHPIYAIADGVVVFSGSANGWGNIILIHHEGLGVWSQYAHNNQNFVKPSQRVQAGQKIGTIGKGGKTRRKPNGLYLAHLHFEIRVANIPAWAWASATFPRATALKFIEANYVDPEKFLEKIKAIETLPDD